MRLSTSNHNKKAKNESGARPNILYGNMLDQMRYFEALEYVKGKDVLDIACGIGWGSYLLSKSGARSVKGIDLSENALLSANKYYYNNNIQYLLGDAKGIPLEANSIDVIVSLETLEHVENVNSFVSELYRVARSNGYLILSTPNAYSHKSNITSKPENPFHFQEYQKEEIENLFINNNWEIISYTGQYPMRIESIEIKEYRKFIFYYWKLKKYESYFGFLGKILIFLIRKAILKSTNSDPAFKESCMPKKIKEGYEPATHFFVFKCLKH